MNTKLNELVAKYEESYQEEQAYHAKWCEFFAKESGFRCASLEDYQMSDIIKAWRYRGMGLAEEKLHRYMDQLFKQIDQILKEEHPELSTMSRSIWLTKEQGKIRAKKGDTTNE